MKPRPKQQKARKQGVDIRPVDEDLLDDIDDWLRDHRTQLRSRRRGLTLIFRAGLYLFYNAIVDGREDLALTAVRYGLPSPDQTRPPS